MSSPRVNDTISDYLDEEEDKAQLMFPHYYQRLKTDGVEHNIYVGAQRLRQGVLSGDEVASRMSR